MTLAQWHQKFMPPSHTLISDMIFSLFCLDGEFDTDRVLLYSLRSTAYCCRLADGGFFFVCGCSTLQISVVWFQSSNIQQWALKQWWGCTNMRKAHVLYSGKAGWAPSYAAKLGTRKKKQKTKTSSKAMAETVWSWIISSFLQLLTWSVSPHPHPPTLPARPVSSFSIAIFPPLPPRQLVSANEVSMQGCLLLSVNWWGEHGCLTSWPPPNPTPSIHPLFCLSPPGSRERRRGQWPETDEGVCKVAGVCVCVYVRH